MTELGRLKASSLGITFNLYSPHSADMEIPTGENSASYRDWIHLYTAKGSAGIFRVTGIEPSIGNSDRVQLRHGVCVLADDAPVFPKNENGGMDEIEGTVSQLLTRLWGMRGVTETPKYWRLGTMAETPVVKYQPGTDSLLQAVQKIIAKTDGYALSFEQSQFPWTLSVIKLPNAAQCEGRFSRNLDGVDIRIDDSEHYTRVYLDNEERYIDADTVGTWGVISYILPVPEGATEESVSAHVADFLALHKDPTVSITCSGVDLSRITGQPLDSMELGLICRACLPKYNTTITERIVTLSVPDVFEDPDGISISMRNKAENASDLIAKIERDTDRIGRQSTVNSRRAGGAAAKAETNRIELVRSSELIEDSRTRMRIAGIVIDGDLGLVKALAREEVVEDVRTRISMAGITIDGPAANVKMLARQETLDGVEKRVKQAEINIDGANSRIDLKADTVVVDALETYINNLIAGSVKATLLRTANISADGANIDGLSLDGDYITKEKATFLTAKTSLQLNSSGGVVTGGDLGRDTGTIYYLAWD